MFHSPSTPAGPLFGTRGDTPTALGLRWIHCTACTLWTLPPIPALPPCADALIIDSDLGAIASLHTRNALPVWRL